MKTLKTFMVLFAFTLISLTATAQLRFVVQKTTGSSVHESFISAYNACEDGDALYLPGGSFKIGMAVISKKIKMIGTGHYPAYTQVGGRTEITGSITLLGGADGSQFHGFYLSGNIEWRANQTIDQITISRCNLQGIILGISPAESQNIIISENVVRGDINGCEAKNLIIEKNIIASIQGFNSSVVIANNVIWSGGGTSCFTNIYSSMIENNVILYNGPKLFEIGSGNTVRNNLFVKSYSEGLNNIGGQSVETIFMDYSVGTFNYESNFNLKETCLGKNAGFDGKDIGIYGTAKPYKEGAIPFNPHITVNNIAASTDLEGKLDVKVTVEAQDY